MNQDKKSKKIDVEWENRVLCSDGNCIGVIGPDGRCRECGLISDQTGEDGSFLARENDTDDTHENITPPSHANEADVATDDEWENRVLCSDESCIGVIGPDGRCKECGTLPE